MPEPNLARLNDTRVVIYTNNAYSMSIAHIILILRTSQELSSVPSFGQEKAAKFVEQSAEKRN